MGDRPNPEDMLEGWITEDCDCVTRNLCRRCDGDGWFFRNTFTGAHISDMMRDAMERHF